MSRTDLFNKSLSATKLRHAALSSSSALQNDKVKAVIFDMGGVIIPPPEALFQHFETAKNLPQGTIRNWIKSGGEEGPWTQLITGKLTLPEFASICSVECSEKVGFDVDVSQLMLAVENQSMQPYDQVITAIKCIKAQGFKTALLTNNCFVSSGETLLPVEKSIFDVIVQSCVEGIRKPSARIYEICLEKLNIMPSESVFLDDIGGNVKTAKSLGMRTIQVTSPDQMIKDLELELGIKIQDFLEDPVTVPERLVLPLDKLTGSLNSELNLQSSGLHT